MIRGRIHQGRVELQDPIPESWEGHFVKILPLTPDDPLPDLESQLSALHQMGPMEYEPGEQEQITRELQRLSESSKDTMKQMGP